MGGAFVAVASDSSATWWNPGGLGAGPFFDMALARAETERAEALPARRQRVSSFAAGTPPVGFGYYRLRITDIQPFDPTGVTLPGREDRRAGAAVRSLALSQVGVTVVHTLVSGLHAGATVKYLRGTLRTSREDPLASPSDLLDHGDALEGGQAEGRFDLDIGVLAVAGPVRLGAVMRNVREPEFDAGGAAAPLRLPRQLRAGVAFEAERSAGVPLTVTLDADLRTYTTAAGDRRVVAIGAEQWFAERRFGVRGGGRINTVGPRERSLTAGASMALRAGVYVDAYGVRGGATDERGFGLGARVSF